MTKILTAKSVLAASVLTAVGLVGASGAKAQMTAQLGDFDLSAGGYVRNFTSMNLQDPPEVKGDQSGDISMFRNQVRVDASAKSDLVSFYASVRGAYEYKTGYLTQLERQGAGAGSGGLMQQYDTIELREFHADFNLGDQASFVVGRQQIVWGESDFFRGTDIVEGFDNRWRSFLETENEELRKPLNLISGIYKFPSINASVQGFIRPALDVGSDIGNTYDLSGGRWANQPNKAVNFFAPSGLPNNQLVYYDYHNASGNVDDVTGGVRFEGSLFNNLNYSFLYLRTFNNNPVLNPSPLVGGVSYGKAPSGLLGDLIYPEVDVYGLTASYQVEPIDTVFALEMAATHGSAWNKGSRGAPLPGIIDAVTGVVRKTSVTIMGRADHTLDLQNIIGTEKPSFFTASIFDTWIPDWKPTDNLIDLVGYSAPRGNHDVIATIILAMDYDNDHIQPSFAAGVDLTNGGGFLIPAVEFDVGDHLRVKFEADLFLVPGSNLSGQDSQNTHVFGYFDNNDQFLVRTTYQF